VILVIEDEPGIVDFLERGLAVYGFEVRSALDGVSGAEQAILEDVDLVVLDLRLPGRGGLEVLALLHQERPTLPVIALTALDDVEDRVAALDAGAVDYLSKPFSLRELVARVRAQLRVASQATDTKLRAGDVTVDLLTREVQRASQRIRLSGTEFDLLVYLLRNHERVLSRRQILRAVWGYEHDTGTNVVDVYIGYLRRKLRDSNGAAPIVTVRSVGYRFDPRQ
jgi:DNA-binding response OmpR family regulator